MSDDRDAWITGIGACTPVGDDYATIATNLIEGRTGIRAVTEFPVVDHPSRIAGRIGPIPAPPGLDPARFAARRPLERLALWCSAASLVDAGWWDRRSEVRVGLVLGLGAEWLVNWEDDALPTGRPRAWDAGSVAQVVREELGLVGPSLVLSAACASGNHAIAAARMWLRLGWADVCVAASCDMGVSPMSMGSFGNLRALSRRNDEPGRACRPFDAARDGFVIGEGGAGFVVEPAGPARRRGARAYAAIAGFGASSDAYHSVIPSPDPGPAARAIGAALADAGVGPDRVDYINAHAPGTPVGDALEAAALAMALGDSTPVVPVSSTKSMTGHLLTAAGAVEAIACIAAIERSAIPPTINLDDPDPRCNLRHVPHRAIEAKVGLAASNSFGFGGSNTCLVLRAV